MALPATDSGAIARLQELAARLRIDIVEMIARAGSGHPGGSLSVIDLCVALYFDVMRYDPKRVDWPDRDRFVLSKGHAVPAQYACLAELGIISHDELGTLRQLGSRLQGHPVASACPGIEANTGSLGQGLSVAQGMAMASKLDGRRFHVWCILGDGEMQEGQVWEALMSAPKYGLDTLTAICDHNNGQIDGHVTEVMPIEPMADKLRSFRWNVIVIDGHDMEEIVSSLATARSHTGEPTFIIARTIKGKGVSFMENNIAFHGAATNPEQTRQALEELRAQLARIQGRSR